MEQHHYNSTTTLGLLLGFISAIGNFFFGWLNDITFIEHLDEYVQAVITGSLGAVSGFMVLRTVKLVEKYIKKKLNK